MRAEADSSTRWYQTWLARIVVAVAVLLAALLGGYGYILGSMTPLHPASHDVPSVMRAAPSRKWITAVEQARGLVAASLIERNLPGLSVAVGAGGEIVWAEGFGWADLDERTPVAPETRFRIGTASTVLTSAAVGLLLEKRRLALDEKIQTYVPEFPEKQWPTRPIDLIEKWAKGGRPQTTPVTLRQLMGHVAGIRNDGGDEGPLLSAHCQRPVDALPYFKDSGLRSEPGTHYRF
ncbi:MAG TPA: serine hydrolase domain-containing protein, partial [Planctomycetaceae bacterium]|nr:serine hydrolase domain-containing protein [Planctomycetaceae bacterium]